MQLNLSYRQIWKISAPIMLGSAAQNVIALSDAVLLYHKGEVDFAAIGFVGVFYITIAAIGYSFSRGGQIMIARRMGEGRPEAVGRTFHTMLAFEVTLALLMWIFMQYGSAWLFRQFLDEGEVYRKCLEYIHYRSYGVFFSYAGVAFIALYTGIARTSIILIDTVILAVVNLALNYGLIFGKFGLPAMGIAGSGLASSIAEGVAFVVFAVFILVDRQNRPLRIFKLSAPRAPEPLVRETTTVLTPESSLVLPEPHLSTSPHVPLDSDARPLPAVRRTGWELIRQQLALSLPVVAHAAVGQGSWVFFFGMVENLGERALAVSNLARTVYLMLSIPLWGFSSGVNTLVSNLIGQDRREEVLAAAWKTGKLCWLVTMVAAVPVLLFPEQLLYPLLGKSDMTLIGETRPVFYLMLVILSMATFGSIFVNALAGTGATWFGLQIQALCIIVYLSYIYFITGYNGGGLVGVWMAEILYWSMMLAMVLLYLRSKRWHGMEF